MSETWKPLSISSSYAPEQPPLFISATFTSNSYAIHLTDLTRIWVESLDRKAILKRSLSEDTAIDPSEDGEQMRLFLQKIEAGIRGDESTKITIDFDSKNSNSDTPCLKLLVTANLPKPLPPLKWPILLVPGATSTFTEKITVPLLAAQNARIKETESLIEVLKDKDHVIQKLVDKLEASGTDLGQIFPVAANKGGKKTSKAQAEEKVKGLGMFEKSRWRKDMAKNQSFEDLKQLAASAFSTDGSLEIRHDEDYSIPNTWKDWWKSGEKLTRTAEKVQPAAKLPTLSQNEEEDVVDDFQVQSTPPPQHSQSSNNRPPSATLDDDSTEDEDLDAPSQQSVVPDSFPLYAPPKPESETRKLGVIGKAKKIAERPSIPLDSPSLVDDKSTEDEVTASPSPPPPSLPEQKDPAPVKRKKGGLGKIGGRKKEASPPPLPLPIQSKADSPSDNDKPQDATPKKAPRRLGVIGRKTQRDSPISPVTEVTRGRSPIAQEKEESPPRETSEERTLRKREAIQQELSEKAKKPVKKKRKF